MSEAQGKQSGWFAVVIGLNALVAAMRVGRAWKAWNWHLGFWVLVFAVDVLAAVLLTRTWWQAKQVPARTGG